MKNTNDVLIKCYNRMQGVGKILLFLLFRCIDIVLLRLLLSLFALTWNAEVCVTEIWISCKWGSFTCHGRYFILWSFVNIYIYIIVHQKKKLLRNAPCFQEHLYDYSGFSSVTFVPALMERVANNVNIKTGKLQCSSGGIKNIKINYFTGGII